MSSETVEQRAARLSAVPEVQFGVKTGLVAGTSDAVRDIWSRRELLGRLVSRELKARYKDSSLGFLWSLFKPLSQLLIYYLVIGKVLGASRGIPEFAIFVFSGLTIWSYFLEIVTGGTGSIVANAGLVKKVYLPREIFPLSAVGTSAVNAGIQLVVLCVGIVALRSFPHPSDLPYALLAILLVTVFALALALVLSATNVYLRDIQHLVEVLTFLAFWASPIVYAYKYVATAAPRALLELYLANPVTLAVLGFQRGMWAAGVSEPYPSHLMLRMLIALAVSLLALLAAHRIFIRLEGNFAQEL